VPRRVRRLHAQPQRDVPVQRLRDLLGQPHRRRNGDGDASGLLPARHPELRDARDDLDGAGLTDSITSCSGDASKSCTCTVGAHGTLTDNGTYTTSRTSVTTTDSNGPGKPIGYCVTGGQLEIGLAAGNTTYVVLTKQ
jgi:hypothetical protein